MPENEATDAKEWKTLMDSPLGSFFQIITDLNTYTVYLYYLMLDFFVVEFSKIKDVYTLISILFLTFIFTGLQSGDRQLLRSTPPSRMHCSVVAGVAPSSGPPSG